METLKFKTSLKCSGCVEKVKPELDQTEGVENWSVDLNSSDKELTVVADRDRTDEVKQALEKSGYQAERKN